MSFFENEDLQYGVLQLMCHKLFFIQIVMKGQDRMVHQDRIIAA